MKIHQLRNATIIVEIGPNRILIDPMLSPKNMLPPLRIFGARQRNPLVELPGSAAAALESVTHCLITQVTSIIWIVRQKNGYETGRFLSSARRTMLTICLNAD